MTDHEQIRELISVYALGAVTAEEATRLELHIERCDSCRRELTTHLTTAAALGGRAEPPSDVWPRILADLDESQHALVVDLAERRTRRLASYFLAAAAALALVFAGALFTRLADGDSLGSVEVAAAADEAASRPGSIVADFVVEEEAVARLVLTPEGQGFVIPSPQLPGLDASRTYQLWVINGDGAVISAGVLGNEPGPSVFTWTGEVSGLALTREVAGGVVSSEGDVVSVVTEF